MRVTLSRYFVTVSSHSCLPSPLPVLQLRPPLSWDNDGRVGMDRGMDAIMRVSLRERDHLAANFPARGRGRGGGGRKERRAIIRGEITVAPGSKQKYRYLFFPAEENVPFIARLISLLFDRAARFPVLSSESRSERGCRDRNVREKRSSVIVV